MRIRNIIIPAALAAATLIGTASGANAATAPGFLGKGEVQSAMGWNNAALQKAVDADKALVAKGLAPTNIVFIGEQTTTTITTDSGVLYGTQYGTQDVEQSLTCDFTNGNGTKTFHRSGDRTATRDASKDASKTATRESTQSSKVSSTLVYDARKTGQWTGFNLSAPVTSGAPVVTIEAGDWVLDAEWTVDEDWTPAEDSTIVWGDWVGDVPGSNPSDCDRSQDADHITLYDLSEVTATSDVTPVGDVATDPAGVEQTESVTGTPATGPLTLFVNGRPLA